MGAAFIAEAIGGLILPGGQTGQQRRILRLFRNHQGLTNSCITDQFALGRLFIIDLKTVAVRTLPRAGLDYGSLFLLLFPLGFGGMTTLRGAMIQSYFGRAASAGSSAS